MVPTKVPGNLERRGGHISVAVGHIQCHVPPRTPAGPTAQVRRPRLLTGLPGSWQHEGKSEGGKVRPCPCHPSTPHLRSRSEVPKANHLTVIQRGVMAQQRGFQAGLVSVGNPLTRPCAAGLSEFGRRFSPEGKVGLLIGPGSQGTPVGTCPAVSVSPACGGSTAHSKLSEIQQIHGGSEGGSPVGKRPSGDRTGVSGQSILLPPGPLPHSGPFQTCSLGAKFPA